MGLLDRITNANDIKELSISELNSLAEEIREFLLQNVSMTGGHLASNLGIVELTLAIHKVFDTSNDRLIFDVGHQCYVHKLLTGRRAGFENLRKFGGMSGFSRPSESEHDACVSGHASNSVSVALGMARARTLQNDDYSVISIIGDGALTGGMAYEGLSDAGQSREPLIVILNDNEMSITKNVGAVSKYLAKLRLKPRYLHFKGVYRKIVKKTKLGILIDNGLHGIKDALKRTFIPSHFFEDMGFTYLGPASGHDIKYMAYLLELARDLKRPVIIHLTTVKGKGYKFSELSPENYHGVGRFDIDTGAPISSGGKTFSQVFGDELSKLADENDKICAITAAMTSGVGLSDFANRHSDRFFDVAIAEGHAVAMAAGLSSRGMIPVCAIYSTFLQRAYDMLVHDIAISGQHVIFAVDRAGLVGQDGETHHGVFDIAFLSDIPGMTILAPSNFAELSDMLRYAAFSLKGPVAIRYGRGGEGQYVENSFCNKSLSERISEGNDITLVSYGNLINNVVEASELAKNSDITCDVIKLNSLKPIDDEKIVESVRKTGRLIVVEDVIAAGSIGEKISAMLLGNGIACKVKLLNTGDAFVTHGENDKLYNQLGLDAEGIYKSITEAL